MIIAGIKKHISFHCSRHTFGTLAGELGVPYEIIQNILGHTDMKTTLIYARITDKVKIKEMGKWNI